jgi:DNA adenine methylase
MAKPFIPWPGGKRKLAKHILPLLGEHTCYVEPFAGGAAILFMKNPAKAEVLNDIDGELVNLYRIVKNHPTELLAQFNWTLISRSQWDEWMQTPPQILTDVQRAARFLYLQKMAFGASVRARTFGTACTSAPRLNLNTLEHDIAQAYERLARVTIENLSWEKIFQKYDRPATTFFCDPPYWQLTGYATEFGWEHYERLAEIMQHCQGRVVLSINDHPDIRRLFHWLKPIEIDYTYTSSNAAKTDRTKSTELIYVSDRRTR